MDYKEKYNKLVEAIKVLQETNPSDEGIQNWVNDNVPELAESRNEKVRKWIYNYFRSCFPTWIHPDITCGEILDWLEKQGTSYTKRDVDDAYVEGMAFAKDELEKQEQKPNSVLDIEIPFGAKDSELQEATYLIPEGFHAEIEGDMVVMKKGKQKPAWSEEDEKIRKELIDAFNEGLTYYGGGSEWRNGISYGSLFSWLNKYHKNNSELSEEEYRKAYYEGWNRCNIAHERYKEEVKEGLKSLQPKQTWSEEDEKIYQSIIDDTVQENQLDDKQISWLKSIKERYTWKQRIEEPSPKEDNNVNDETNAPTEYGKYVDECLYEASKHFFSEGEDKYSVADLFYAGVRCGKKYDKSPKDVIAIGGVCSDKDFIDTEHGILAFGAEEGSYRPFNDGDKVKIIITKGE